MSKRINQREPLKREHENTLKEQAEDALEVGMPFIAYTERSLFGALDDPTIL